MIRKYLQRNYGVVLWFLLSSIVILLSVIHHTKHTDTILDKHVYIVIAGGISILFNTFFVFNFIKYIFTNLSKIILTISLASSFLFAIEILTKYHLHYVPYILLSFIIWFNVFTYLVTLNLTHIKTTTLDDVYDIKNNSFTLIRFFLASSIFFFHYIALNRHATYFQDIFHIYIGAFTVWLFMCISGFFMIQSIQHSKTSYEFLAKRFLRIFPLFLFLTLISIIGKSFINGYIQGGHELLSNLFLGAFDKEYTFFLLFDAGPSWTLKIEFSIYLLLLLVYMSLSANKKYIAYFTILLLVINIFIMAQGKPLYLTTIFSKSPIALSFMTTGFNENVLGFACAFFMSALFFLYKKNIPCNKHTLLLSLLLIWFISQTTYALLHVIITIVLAPYAIVCIGSMYKIKLWTRFGDYSYGIYLIHGIVFLAIDHVYQPVHSFLNFLFIYILVVVLSIISWHFIEFPMIKLKKYIK